MLFACVSCGCCFIVVSALLAVWIGFSCWYGVLCLVVGVSFNSVVGVILCWFGGC